MLITIEEVIQIQIASVADIEALTNVEVTSKLGSFPEPLDAIAIDPDIRSYRWQTYFNGESPVTAKPERIVFKALRNGKIIGFIAGHLTTRHDKDAEIQNFYVLKDEQRKSIGSLLLDNLLTWLKRQGAKSLCVGIAPENPYQKFYIKYGGLHLNPHWIYWDDLDEVEQRLRIMK
jgi:GNAT superfamily N-acetyltransferase